MAQDDGVAAPGQAGLPEIRVPAALTFAGLIAGLVLGLVLSGSTAGQQVARIAAPVGALWLRALQMTIVPLVAGLLFTGVTRTVAAADGGALARRTVGSFALILALGALLAGVLMPLLLAAFPVPAEAVGALSGAQAAHGRGSAAVPGSVPHLADFLAALVPENAIDAAARTAMLPLVTFVALFALAATRLPAPQRDLLAGLFEALAAAMMVVIGWVLAVAPAGVFALAFGVTASSGLAAVAALAHYIVLVAAIGGLILLGAYAVAVFGGGAGLGAFARALLPVQALALSTQSSLACLPAMLAACRRLNLRETGADLVLPLAVTVFRATSPAMNLAVAIYAAKLTGVPITPAGVAIGVLVSLVTTIGSVSLPGTVSFIASIAPIALAMGVPLGPLGLLVAVELLPDLMRTIGNVTMDVAVTAAIDRRGRQ